KINFKRKYKLNIMLEKINLFDSTLENGTFIKQISLYYQVFGQEIGSAPVVVVNHALTGNSNVTGKNGWWNDLIGKNKTIDTNYYTLIAFNIPGNGFDEDPENLINNYQDFTAKDISLFFWKGLFHLHIYEIFALIGGSLGGGIAWEMANLEPNKIQNLIPIATDWKATDSVIANVLVQDRLLSCSENPIENARIHAMLLYRTPESLKDKFKREKKIDSNVFQIEKWLINHGEKLKNRFHLSSYKLMNHLLKTIDIAKDSKDAVETISKITASIHIVSVDTDLFFIAKENIDTYEQLKEIKNNIFYHEIKSIHGHDAFLIEFEQLNTILTPIFNKQKQNKYVNA
uniref:alpha/beta fold hydrolase n=1 Tax=uncultured Flavobacterium sp. TaxID=165435 RepID=UPI0030CA4924